VAVYDTYASRLQRAEKAGQPDVYTYDQLSQFLRKQLSQIFTDCIGPGYACGDFPSTPPPNANDTWDGIVKIFDREQPDFERFASGSSSYEACMSYLKDLSGYSWRAESDRDWLQLH
jgi:hypothetical protein